jgi:hypothetical protein
LVALFSVWLATWAERLRSIRIYLFTITAFGIALEAMLLYADDKFSPAAVVSDQIIAALLVGCLMIGLTFLAYVVGVVRRFLVKNKVKCLVKRPSTQLSPQVYQCSPVAVPNAASMQQNDWSVSLLSYNQHQHQHQRSGAQTQFDNDKFHTPGSRNSHTNLASNNGYRERQSPLGHLVCLVQSMLIMVILPTTPKGLAASTTNTY